MTLHYTIVIDTLYGKMMVNRHDINQTHALLKTGVAIDRDQVRLAQYFCQVAPERSLMLDIGANFGTYSLACAPLLNKKHGQIHAFEGQRILANMLCGSVALNSIENIFVHNVCVGDSTEAVAVPKFNYSAQLNFGSVEFRAHQREPLHQTRGETQEWVPQVRIDGFQFSSVCFMKIDVEGMEVDVLDGATQTIARTRPVALIEYIKSDHVEIAARMQSHHYTLYVLGGDLLCLPTEKRFEGLSIDLPRYSESMKIRNHQLVES